MRFCRPQNCQKFPVKFPVSREFGQRRVSARLPPPPASLNRRETCPGNKQRCPYFVIFRPQSGLERTDCPGSNGVNLPAFLWTAHAQSGFSDFNGRHVPLPRGSLVTSITTTTTALTVDFRNRHRESARVAQLEGQCLRGLVSEAFIIATSVLLDCLSCRVLPPGRILYAHIVPHCWREAVLFALSLS